LVTVNKYNGKFSAHVMNSANKMALTHVNALLVQQKGLSAYSLQNVLLLVHVFQVFVTNEQ